MKTAYSTLMFISALSLPAIGAECPAQNFEDFAYDFMEHADIQKRYTQLPLRVVQGSGDPDIAPTEEMMTAAQLDFPIVENHAIRTQLGYLYVIEDPLTIRFFTAGSGVLIRYKFQQLDSCWQLIAKEDDSM